MLCYDIHFGEDTTFKVSVSPSIIRVLNYNYGYLQIQAIFTNHGACCSFCNNRTEKNATSWSYDRLKELLEGLTLEDDKRESHCGPLIQWSSDTVVR